MSCFYVEQLTIKICLLQNRQFCKISASTFVCYIKTLRDLQRKLLDFDIYVTAVTMVSCKYKEKITLAYRQVVSNYT